MKAIVCVKQVPDTSGKVAVKADGTMDRASMATITNPDDMNAIEAALKLKDALVLRCSGMALQHGGDEKGPWLKITYYDEDGADVSERFRLQTPAQRTAAVLNAGAAIYVAIDGLSLKDAMQKAQDVIDDGSAYKKLQAFIRITNEEDDQ